MTITARVAQFLVSLALCAGCWLAAYNLVQSKPASNANHITASWEQAGIRHDLTLLLEHGPYECRILRSDRGDGIVCTYVRP